MNRAKAAGDAGEAAVAHYLEGRGCVILERQWHCRWGELDLIARTREGILCFVEVKLRNCRSVTAPRESVDLRKQERLRKAGLCYLSAHEDAADAFCRFDIAEVYDMDGRLELRYCPDAFV